MEKLVAINVHNVTSGHRIIDLMAAGMQAVVDDAVTFKAGPDPAQVDLIKAKIEAEAKNAPPEAQLAAKAQIGLAVLDHCIEHIWQKHLEKKGLKLPPSSVKPAEA